MRSRLGKRERRAREDSVTGETNRHLTYLTESQPKLIRFGDYILENLCGEEKHFKITAEERRVLICSKMRTSKLFLCVTVMLTTQSVVHAVRRCWRGVGVASLQWLGHFRLIPSHLTTFDSIIRSLETMVQKAQAHFEFCLICHDKYKLSSSTPFCS